jgi:uncharacterized protein (TIGR03086 family)
MTELSTDELLARGRDREAVDKLAAALQAPVRTADEGKTMDGVQQLDEIIPLLRRVVAGLTPAQYDDPTPCRAFTVEGVLEHMIGGAIRFAPAFRGGPSPEPAAAGDTLERWHAATAELLAAVHAEGAQDRTIASPFGEVDGAFFARYVAFDGLMHAWDLGRATSQEIEIRPEVVAAVDGFARSLLGPELRDGDTFAAEQEPPAGASALDRLAAFTGRTAQVAATS